MKRSELKKIRVFHGHLGPWVVTGYVLGQLAKKCFDKIEKITVETPLKPPYSCLVDGVQLSTGLTIGRGEVEIKKSRQSKVGFISGNRTITILLDSSFFLITRQFKKLGGQKYSVWLYHNFYPLFG